ncbi:MAG: glycosyltransferase [Bizionia sp.]|nr:glycosyltransferase [Bizionia sp.]
MILLLVIVTGLYVTLIVAFYYGFKTIKKFDTIESQSRTRFSIVIAFRNEADNLTDLLTSLSQLKYPLDSFEIIFVDDASEDGSAQLIHKHLTQYPALEYSILNNKRISNSPKKDAITTAINTAKNEWIITTDADCIVHNLWLNSIDSYIQNNDCNIIAAPVAYYEIDSLLKRFQFLDFLSLMGATIGGFGIKKPFMCNGANFAYRKETFLKLQGFKGNNNIASGDDIFLLEKAVSDAPDMVHYLKSKHAIVYTKPQSNFNALVQQRKRWAAKTSQYSSSFGKFVGLAVFAMNLILMLGILLVVTAILPLKILISIFVIKTIIDSILLFKTCRFFNSKFSIPFYIGSSIFYPFFTVYIAITALFSNYNWKGRQFKA